MTGPEHYREAAELLARTHRLPADEATVLIAAAAVHAQLAHVAVLAMATLPGGALPDEDFDAWDAAAGVQSDDDD